MSDIEKRARELLAAEYELRGSPRMAAEIRSTELEYFGDSDFAGAIRAVIAALTPPEGYVLVPAEPTPAMSAAGLCVSEAEHDPAGVYRAMIVARPELPHG